ncbi:extracellular solute-binding protein [Pseudomaricurvus albidus]|uniref:extracellular solute-binding protein n=1 Tax=Pseudomaricurvus albidus TaxID=2842452 RepID=UPI001F1C342D|nr:extracellular solute-binding protein [Aestuariicella albida]
MPKYGFFNCTNPRTRTSPLHQILLISTALLMIVNGPAAVSAEIIKSHAIAMHGQPKYGPDFTRFDYTSADAKKGGEIKLHSIGTYDSLNPFVAKGNPADRLGLVYDTLTTSSADEPFTQYGLLAKTLEYPEDRSWVIYHLDPDARFNDGSQVTAEDVDFSFKLLLEKGNPFYGYYYADVIKSEVLDRSRIKFTFREGSSPETLLITGQLPVFPKHFWTDKDFEHSALLRPLGSGPYQITQVDPGRSITYERVSDYWGKNKPAQKGLFNFDKIVVDYYRDDTVALEAFKAGEYDFRYERVAKLWATAYDSQAINDGRIIKKEVAHNNPAGMQAFVFNLRNPLFQDIALRQAIGMAFDFEWTNKNLFYGAYSRTNSYFANSDLASSGLPSKAELALLEPYRDQLPSTVFTEEYKSPESKGDQHNRKNLRAAKKLLDSAGYKVVNGKLMTPDGKQPVNFEILLYDSAFERIANPFVQGLKKLGIDATVSKVDTSQYINRRRDFDFDMITHVFGQSLSPGNEQRDFWSSHAAETPGSRNIIGISNPVIDALVDKVIAAQTREQLVTATHALDRVLLNMHYVIPQWYTSSHRLAYWDKFNQPSTSPEYDVGYGTGLMTWWVKPADAK